MKGNTLKLIEYEDFSNSTRANKIEYIKRLILKARVENKIKKIKK